MTIFTASGNITVLVGRVGEFMINICRKGAKDAKGSRKESSVIGRRQYLEDRTCREHARRATSSSFY
jgi:hypothetical protein